MPTIRSIMRSQVITVGPDTPVRVALELLIEHNISGLPVVEADQTIVGILSEKDLLKVFYESKANASSITSLMTGSPICIAVDAPLVELFDCLMANDFRRVLIEEGGKLVGLVSRADLMPAILEALKARTEG